MKCFYHKSDLDGHCSGAIVKMKYPECEMIGIDYDDEGIEGILSVEHGDTVHVVDFSFNEETMSWLSKFTTLHWIDHHKSAIEKYSGLEEIKGLREIGKAGCELTWEYLYDDNTPVAVKLLGRYDVWDHKDELVLPFQYGFRLFNDTLPGSPVWGMFLNNNALAIGNIEDVIKDGHTVMTYQAKQDIIFADSLAFDTNLEGYRAIAMNRGSGSKMFDSVYDPEKHDIIISFSFNGKNWKYSLYSAKPEIDVSKIAVKYGGGGHAGAAGFYSKTMVV